MDHYEVLQVSVNAEPEVIQAAYKKLAMKYHPDRNFDEASHKRMAELTAAYEVLSDQGRRREYDASKRRTEETRPVQESQPPVRNNGWIWYFGFLFVASVGVAVFMIWFNLSIQLKSEQLEVAHKRWQENGPKSYKLLLKKKLNNEDKVTTFIVTVRNKKVTEVMMDGKPLAAEKEGEQDPKVYHSMDATFSFVRTFMAIDQKEKAPKVYVTALFDPESGALLRYVRRVMGTTQRVELNITLEAID